jgi:hypothetical protein
MSQDQPILSTPPVADPFYPTPQSNNTVSLGSLFTAPEVDFLQAALLNLEEYFPEMRETQVNVDMLLSIRAKLESITFSV